MNSSRLQSALDFIVVPWALWTLYVQVLVYARATFTDLLAWGALPIAAGLGVAYWLVIHKPAAADTAAEGVASSAEPHSFAPWVVLAGIALIWLLSWGVLASLLLFGISLAGFLLSRRGGTTKRALVSATTPSAWRQRWRRYDAVLAGVAIALALVQVLFIVRTSGDDGLYVGSAVAALDFPHLPLLRYDFFYGVLDPPVQYLVVHRPQSHELTVAALARVTGLPVLAIYFLGIQLVAVPLWAGVNYLLARRFLAACPGAVLLGIVLLLAAWGESNRTFGNFGFLRSYQGKVVLLSVIVPWIWLSAWRFAERPDLRRSIVLALVQVVGVGLASIGAVIGPLAAGVMIAAAWVSGRCTWRVVALSAVLTLPATWTLVMLVLERGGQDMTGVAWQGSVLGEALRPAIAMAVIGAYPLLFGGGAARRTPLICMVGLIVAAYLSPLTGSLLGLAASNVSWRYVWAVPVPMLVVVGLVQLARVPMPRWCAPALSGALVIAFAVGGMWSVSPSNRLSHRFLVAKVQPSRLKIAEEISALTPASETVLIPNRYSTVLPFVHQHPLQLVGRALYFRSKFGATLSVDEAAMREALRAYVQSAEPEMSVDAFVAGVLTSNVYTVALPVEHPHADSLQTLLKSHGYHAHRVRDLWVLSRSAAPLDK